MILYHGSCVEVSAPDILHSRSNVDFGRGFYSQAAIERYLHFEGSETL